MPKASESELQKISELYAEGLNDREIAAMVGLSSKQVWRRRQSLALPSKHVTSPPREQIKSPRGEDVRASMLRAENKMRVADYLRRQRLPEGCTWQPGDPIT